MSIGERLNSLRGKKNLAELGQELGVSPQQLSRIENDKSIPSLELTLKICEHFGVTMDWLIRGVEAEPAKVENQPQAGHISIPVNEYLAMKDKIITLQEHTIEKQEKQIERLKNH